MEFSVAKLDWLELLLCVVVGQALLTMWFAVLFAAPWARAYGGPSMTKAQHAQEVPGYTYAMGAVCVLLLSIGVAFLQQVIDSGTIGDAVLLALFLGIFVFLAMSIPGYAFLRRWSALLISAGSQLVLILVISVVLVL